VASNAAVAPIVTESAEPNRVVVHADTLLANAARDAARIALQSLLDDLLRRA
jgi:hypothetical protein